MNGPEPTPDRPPTPVSKAAYVLLGLMTVVSFGGPFGIALILHGGERTGWPPDRTAEWVGMGGVLALFIVCFVACLTARVWMARASGEGRARNPRHRI
ncbi:hypothetical protein [Paludisphaera soli]|uniref:hypothetical protein n=1 Tax=Paludisphaera soli TaxID=2712865 RepID=UPI0013ECE0FD|nr:hypothetical protein [Paludisphaera soli]